MRRCLFFVHIAKPLVTRLIVVSISTNNANADSLYAKMVPVVRQQYTLEKTVEYAIKALESIHMEEPLITPIIKIV